MARNVMGRLGLGGEKPLRMVAALSGGEKARVALSMFALKASNLLMLDEPSNVSVMDIVSFYILLQFLTRISVSFIYSILMLVAFRVSQMLCLNGVVKTEV